MLLIDLMLNVEIKKKLNPRDRYITPQKKKLRNTIPKTT
jgi:hypothetical protein